MIKQYGIVMMVSGTPITYYHNGQPLIFDDPQKADKYCKDRNSNLWFSSTPKYKVKALDPINPDIWIKREKERLKSGEYKKVPWHKTKWASKNKECELHFAHISKESYLMVAFTESHDKGNRDIQTTMNASKYLSRFYSKIIAESTIRRWVALLKKKEKKELELKFAKKKREIIKVYKDGPKSCMKGHKSPGNYAGPDFAVAYVLRKGKIVARTVCLPKKKVHTRIYGDEALMKEMLKGFRHSHEVSDWRGARLSPGRQPHYDFPHYGNKRTGDYVVVQ